MNLKTEKLVCDGVIFDVDGTIWDATETIVKAYNTILERHTRFDYRLTADDLKRVFGLPMDEIGRRVFKDTSPEESHELMAQVLAIQPEVMREDPPAAFEGVRDVFALLSRKIPVLIVSNCQAGYISDCLSLTGLAAFVREGICPADTGLLKADNIRLIAGKYGLSHPVYVGDTAGDQEASINAGVPFVFASYGYGRTQGADAVLSSITELPSLLELL